MIQALPRRNPNQSAQVDASLHFRFLPLVFRKDPAPVLFSIKSTELFDELGSYLLVALPLLYHQLLHSALVHLHAQNQRRLGRICCLLFSLLVVSIN